MFNSWGLATQPNPDSSRPTYALDGIHRVYPTQWLWRPTSFQSSHYTLPENGSANKQINVPIFGYKFRLHPSLLLFHRQRDGTTDSNP